VLARDAPGMGLRRSPCVILTPGSNLTLIQIDDHSLPFSLTGSRPHCTGQEPCETVEIVR
jgi:hypothetical protein